MGNIQNATEGKVAVYVRESRDDNGENIETLETQRDLLIDFVKREKLGRICGVYEDDNVSGTTFERDGLTRLRKDILNNVIDTIVIKDLSRLGRNNAKTLEMLDFFEECGIHVLSHDGRYDSLRDNETVGIDSWYNERYVRDISKKTRASLRHKISKGEYIGTAPYGYIKSSVEKNRLVVEQNEACVIRKIYEMYIAGCGYTNIALKLSECGIEPPSSKFGCTNTVWNASTIRRILSNQVYAGDTVQGVSEKISFKSKRTKRLPEDKWVITNNTHEAIIDKEMFDKVQKIRSAKKPGAISHKGNTLFKGLIYCGKCGSIMVARRRSNRPMSYICSKYARSGLQVCTSHHIREDTLFDAVYEEIVKLLYNLQRDEYRDDVLNIINSESIELEQSKKAFTMQLQKKIYKQDMLYMDKMNGSISDDQFKRLNMAFEKDIDLICKEMKQLEYPNNITNYGKIDFLKKVEELLQRCGLNREIIGMIVEKITVFYPDDLNESATIAGNLYNIEFREHVTAVIQFLHSDDYKL